HEPAEELDHRAVLDGDLLVALLEKELDAGEDEEDGEEVENPVEPMDERRPDENEHAPQGNGTEDAEEEHPVLGRLRHAEVGEDNEEDEEVVDRERILQQIASEELK